ncbi:MAG: helix-turn-helix domain-containing protein [Candidatus Omnitrophota bacterium]|nr:helix-turn-helix domain-containing protein [Candidatus Omnitrophota bacterium]
MGVIYKTKGQIKDFILEAKKADSNLSCRQLAPLIQEKFGISLSKSTINNLFKAANLSAPVGRKSLKEKAVLLAVEQPKPVVEEMPELAPTAPSQPLLSTEKLILIEAPKEPVKEPIKEPVVESIIESVIITPPPALEPKIAPPPEPVSLPPAPAPEPEKKAPEPQIIPEKPPEEKPAPMPFIPKPVVIKEDTIKSVPVVVPEVSQPIEIKEDEILDGLGCFFLKAAEWQLSGDPILGGLLRKYLTQANPEELNLNSEILLYLEAFGLSDWKAFEQYNQKGLWVVNQAPAKKSPESLLKFADSLKRLRGLSLALFNEYNQYFSEIRYLKITLEDGSVFYLDPQLRTLWQDSNIPENLAVTSYKTNTYVKKLFQENSQIFILQTVPGSNAFAKVLSEFIWSFEGLAGKNIQKVGLYNLKREEVERIEDPPGARRYFIAGFWPWQEEGMRLIREDLRIVKSFVMPEQGREIYYSENATNISQPIGNKRVTLRVGLIRDSALGWPKSGVLTNIPIEWQSMQEVIMAYLRRWPNQEEGYQDLVKRSSKFGLKLSGSTGWESSRAETQPQVEYSLSLASTDLRTNLNSLLLALNNLCQRNFFPRGYDRVDFATMQKRFYLIAGQIERRNNFLKITLIPPRNYAFLADLIYAANRLNEANIETPARLPSVGQGQEKIIIKIA